MSRIVKHRILVIVAAIIALAFVVSPASAEKKPNILVIMSDDVGMWNISSYHRGMMGGSTPNIDKIAKEGAMFTDYYAQQSCTAGRAAFITGQHPFRTGLLTIGMPGADQGLQAKDPTLAELLKPHGYVSGQFGKNHLGDMDKYLPTNHGFDEFFGNLYHLNAEEEPETYHYPKDHKFHEKFGPRGVLHSYADGRVEDTGPLTRKRMETADEEFLQASIKFIEKAVKQKKPFFVWLNTTRMHIWTRLGPKWYGKTGYGIYADGMAQHDHDIGVMLDKLDELGIADNTIVIYTTDNGAEVITWPDGGTIPFRGEKGTTWEGGFRVPAMVRWPGVVKPGTIINDIFSHEDWVPTLMAAVGEPDIKEKLKKGYKAGDKRFKVHLDGYNQMDLLSSKGPGNRHEILYFGQTGNLNAIRYDDWKLHFTILEGGINTAYEKTPTWPVLFNLRMDPFERSYFESGLYLRWYADQMWTFVPAQKIVGKFLATFEEFPPSQKGASLSIGNALDKLKAPPTTN